MASLEKLISNYDTAVFFTDEHIPYINEDMVSIVEQYLSDAKPKYRVHGGDLFDNPGMSNFDADANHKRDTQEEIDMSVKYLNQLHLASPDTKTVIIYGNHDYGRLERSKRIKAYGYQNLRTLDLEHMIRESSEHQNLEIGDVKFVKKWTLAKSVVFFHGDPNMEPQMKGGLAGPRRTAELYPGEEHLILGHKHRKYVGRDQWKDREVHHVAGMLDVKHQSYPHMAQYENGFAVIHYNSNVRPKPEVHIQNIIVRNKTACVDGKIYKPNGNIRLY